MKELKPIKQEHNGPTPNFSDKISTIAQNLMNPTTLEGKYPTTSGDILMRTHGFKDLGGSTDYYIGGTKDEPVIMGEVGLEGGNVIGVYGSDPGSYGTGKHLRKTPKYKSKKQLKKEGLMTKGGKIK